MSVNYAFAAGGAEGRIGRMARYISDGDVAFSETQLAFYTFIAGACIVSCLVHRITLRFLLMFRVACIRRFPACERLQEGKRRCGRTSSGQECTPVHLIGTCHAKKSPHQTRVFGIRKHSRNSGPGQRTPANIHRGGCHDGLPAGSPHFIGNAPERPVAALHVVQPPGLFGLSRPYRPFSYTQRIT